MVEPHPSLPKAAVKPRRLELQAIEFHKLSVDDCGTLFTWENRLFRAIHPEAVDTVKDMFQSGMLDELIAKRLFVRSWITDYCLEGYGLIVEHERISPLIYPYEWSFSMLKDAALAVLSINAIARRYGYQTKDCHGYNICFDGVAPLFVDLGSFERVDRHNAAWSAYEEFLSFYYYPLRIWRHGNHYFARRALLGCSLNDMMTHSSYFLYQVPLLRFLSQRHLATLLRWWVYGRTVSLNPRKLLSFVRQTDFKVLRLRDLARLQVIDFASLKREVEKISLKKYRTEWGGYQEDYFDAWGNPKSPGRFERIIEVLESYEMRTVLELAGNRGAFSYRLAQLGQIEKIACTDHDERAVEALYVNAKKGPARIVPAILDFMFPMTNYANNKPPFERFKADAVVALAVIHHLVLRQKLSIDAIHGSIASYTRRYAFVEFMPLGLHSPGEPVDVPSWYTTEWFKESFEKFFVLLRVERLEENRILFVGEVRTKPAG